jgi:RNA polymerase sigma-70 factor (ECF subfamily)
MKSDQYTSIGEARGSFQTTHWTAIETIKSDDDIISKALIGDLLKNYWKPVYCYLRHKGYDNEQAKDLTQSFFHEVVLGRELIIRADHTKGRFRNLLLTALDRYLVSMHRKETTCKRIPQNKLISLEDAGFKELPAVVDNMNSGEVFQYTWVCEMLDRILEKVEIECRQRGMAMHWSLFYDRVLLPAVTCTKSPSLAELCRKYGVHATTKASSMIFTVKKRIQAATRCLLSESVASEHEIDEEVVELLKFLLEGRQYCQ